MPGHIFISYHYDNGDFADNLRMKLKENGFDVWMSEAALNCGDNWRAEIDQAIEEASALILVKRATAHPAAEQRGMFAPSHNMREALS